MNNKLGGLAVLGLLTVLAPSIFAQYRDQDARLSTLYKQIQAEVAKTKAQAGAKTINEQLIDATKSGRIGLVDGLLAKGADINAQDSSGFTALNWACINRRVDLAKLFIAKHADLNIRDTGGATTVMRAAGNGYLEILRILIDAGADLTLEDGLGNTALSTAFYTHHPEAEKIISDAMAKQKK